GIRARCPHDAHSRRQIPSVRRARRSVMPPQACERISSHSVLCLLTSLHCALSPPISEVRAEVAADSLRRVPQLQRFRQCSTAFGGYMLTAEKVFPITEIGERLPGRPVHSTLWRWCVEGLQGVTLEHLALGNKLLTSIEAVERFGRELAAARAARR